MNLEISLVIGLLLGAVYAVTRRSIASSKMQVPGGAMLVKWPLGIGRASVMEVKSGTIRLTPPIMRSDFAPPEPGAEILLKPLGGGQVRRARFVAHGDAGWTVRLA